MDGDLRQNAESYKAKARFQRNQGKQNGWGIYIIHLKLHESDLFRRMPGHPVTKGVVNA